MLNLFTATPHVHARRKPPQPTDRDRAWVPGVTADRILQLLIQFRYATPAMLAWAYQTLYGAGASAVRHEITRLDRAGLLTRFWQPVPPFAGTAPHVCIATVAGARRVVSHTGWPAVRKQVSNRAVRPLASYAHPVALSLLEMAWRLGAEARTTWRTISYSTDRVRGFQVQLQDTVRVVPDAVALMYNVKQNYYRPVLIEVDLVHRSSERLRQRVLAYRELLGAQQDVVRAALSRAAGVPVMSPMALYLGADPAHADRLRSAAHDALELGTLFGAQRRVPDLWFAPLSALASGGTILPADAVFTRDLAVSVTGKIGRMLP